MITLKARYGAAIEAAIGKAKASRKREAGERLGRSGSLCMSAPQRHRVGCKRVGRPQPAARPSAAGRRRRSRKPIGGLDNVNARRRRAANTWLCTFSPRFRNRAA
jgi:hypothetical protein